MPFVRSAGEVSASNCSGLFGIDLLLSTREGPSSYGRMNSVREPLSTRLIPRVLNFAAAIVVVLGITFVYRVMIHVNSTTVALTFLLAVLVVSTTMGIAVSVFMSVAAMMA